MTFRLRHEWVLGAVLTAELATCSHCETLRVSEDGETLYIKRAIDPISEDPDRPGNLVLALEPPCIGPTAPFKAPW